MKDGTSLRCDALNTVSRNWECDPDSLNSSLRRSPETATVAPYARKLSINNRLPGWKRVCEWHILDAATYSHTGLHRLG